MALTTRRSSLVSLASVVSLLAQSQQTAKDEPPEQSKDWTCPMDAEVRSDKPGKCPRCGMKLVLKVPDRVEYPVEITQKPDSAKPGELIHLTFRVLHPDTGKVVRNFEIVHEKLIHLFLVSENLEFFAHEHPQLQSDGGFQISLRLPNGGMYRVLCDFYPAGATPQLAVNTLFVAGKSPLVPLTPSLSPSHAANLTATLRREPEQLLAGLESHLYYSLDPFNDLQPYLGAWAHMLVASGDLIDLLHVHPFLVRDGRIQFNIIFPRPGLYRIWTQFQRAGVVNTTMFTVPVKAL